MDASIRLRLSCAVAAVMLALLAAGASAAPDSPPETALADYVAAPDPSFRWRVHARYPAPHAEIVELRLESQTWKGTLWKHRMFLIKPDSMTSDKRQGLLVIGGGRWRASYETEVVTRITEDSDATLFLAMAQRLGTVVAVVGQVPFQPLFDLTEDELISYTFERYLETGDAEWPLLLPMVKAAVRAMDAAQAAASEQWDVRLDTFTLLGGSKRGWTTWLTGVVDRRASTLVPVVIDALNLEAHLPHQRAMWGAMSPELEPYTSRNLDEILASDAGRPLRRIVDPYSYRDQLTQPKLIVIGTNDAYFPVDALNLYWDDLPDPKYALYLPNNGHDVDDFARLIPAVAALHRRDENDEPLPRLEWQFDDAANGLRLCVRSDPRAAAVFAWSAESEDTDFRDEVFAPEPVEARSDVFVLDVAPPASGYKAVFAEAMVGDGGERYSLSTNVRILDESGRPPAAAAVAASNGRVCAPTSAQR